MQPGASDDTHTHVTRARPAWTTRPGWRAPRARRTAPPGWDTPSHGARRTRSTLVLGVLVRARYQHANSAVVIAAHPESG
jgi:hypothetical protein